MRRGEALLRLTRYSEAAADDTAALSRLMAAPSRDGRSAEDLRTSRAELLCNRGKAEAGMGHYAMALSDVTQAIHLWPEISERGYDADPDGLRGLAERVWREGKVTVVCSHRPVLPALCRALGLKVGKFSTGSFLVAHRLADGRLVHERFGAP